MFNIFILFLALLGIKVALVYTEPSKRKPLILFCWSTGFLTYITLLCLFH